MTDGLLVHCSELLQRINDEGPAGPGAAAAPSVRVQRDPRARHQALREHLRDMA